MKFKSKLTLIFTLLIILGGLFFIAINSRKYSDKKFNQSPIIVGFAQLGAESAWRNANTESVKNAARDAGICLIYKNADGSQNLQKQIIQDFIIQNVDIIILPPLVTTGWEEVLLDAKKANIPVILADRTIEPNDTNLYSVFVGEDFLLEGKKAAKWLVKNTDASKKINVVELRGLADSSPTVDRAKGFRSIISEHKNITFLDSVPGDFIKVQGKMQMHKLLKKYGRNINVVFSHNDDMALGAIEAIQEYGLKPGKDILIISFDGGKAALRAIEDGKANVSVECTPMLGPTLMKTVKKLYNKESVPKKIVMEEKVFTKENVKAELPLRRY